MHQGFKDCKGILHQLCGNKRENLEVDTKQEKYKLPKLTQGEAENEKANYHRRDWKGD